MKNNKFKTECEGIIEKILQSFHVKLEIESGDYCQVNLINIEGTCERMLFSATSWKGLRDKLYIFKQGIECYLDFNQKLTAK